MKRKILNLFQIVAITAMAFTSNSCSDLLNDPLKDKNTGEDINLLLVDLNFFDTKIILKFQDFDTGELLTGQNITAAVVGNNADKFVNLFGEKKEMYETSSGIMELYLDPSYTFTGTPIQLDVFAYSEPDYLSEPTSFEISEAGERTIVVKMIDWSKSAPVLKSAMADATINVEIENNDENIKTKPIPGIDANGYTKVVQYNYRIPYDEYASTRSTYKTISDRYKKYADDNAENPSLASYYLSTSNRFLKLYNALPAPPTTPDVKLTATNISVDEKTLDYWGFDNNKGKEVTLKGGEAAYTTYKSNLEKCESGLTIKISCPDLDAGDKTSSADFKYKIEFSDGTELNGEIGGTFSDLSTTGAKIEPIYYPANSKITVTLEENPQYTFDTPSQTNLDPCGVATFVAKKKTGFTTFKFSTSYSCLSSSVALKYTGKGYVKNKTKNTGEEFFDLVAGQFTLNLIKGDQYELTVIIDSKAYSMNLDTNNILGSTVSDSNISSFSISPDTEGENSYKLDLKLNNDDLCSKL